MSISSRSDRDFLSLGGASRREAATSLSVEQRRTIRIKRSGLLRNRLADIDRPAIKMAENLDELQQAFSLRHDVYVKTGYLEKPTLHGMLFSIHSLLPETTIFVAKSYLTVISTMTEVFDTEVFGLPMDAVYKREVDSLRNKGRTVVELSALASHKKFRWLNLFMHLSQVMYWYSMYRGVNDLCAAVVPKHVRFYRDVLLFEELGPERSFPKVKTNTVALRVNMDVIAERLQETYGSLEFDTNLYEYFHRMTGVGPSDSAPAGYETGPESPLRDSEMVRNFLEKEPELLVGLNLPQREFLKRAYPGLGLLS